MKEKINRRDFILATGITGASLLLNINGAFAKDKPITAKTGTANKLSAGLIDVHSHAVLPIGAQAPLAKQPDWSVEGTLAMMDRHNIGVCVLSCPNSANIAEGQEANDIARRMNETLADIVAKHPTRFGAMATLPGRNPDGLLTEMAYALDTLKMDGICTSTSINDVYLGEDVYDPWFEEMNRRAVTLFVHPTVAMASLPLSMGVNVSMLEFVFDTTRMLTNMLFSGAKKRYSQIKIISTHGGGTIPYLVKRLQLLEAHFGPGRDRTPLTPQEIKEGLASFYYDLTAATSVAQLGAILELVPTSQLLFGADNPFMPESSVGSAIADLESYAHFNQADLKMIGRDNALSLYPSVRSRLAGYSPG